MMGIEYMRRAFTETIVQNLRRDGIAPRAVNPHREAIRLAFNRGEHVDATTETIRAILARD